MARTVKLGSLAPGLNNRREPTRLQMRLPDRSTATYLHAAENIDVTSQGYVKRRSGQVLALAGAAHSLWSDKQGGFVVLDGVLTALSVAGAGLAGQAVRAEMPALPVSYSRGADGDTYWSNGETIRRVAADQDLPIATEPPSSVPYPVIAGGALAAGRYLVALTVSSEHGESPATPVLQVQLDENEGIAFADLAMAGRAVNLYASAPDGDILTLQGTSSTGEIAMLAHTENGRRCSTLNRALMPAGTVVRHYNGRMLVASGSTVYMSEPYTYGLYNPSAGYIPFRADVTVIEPTDNGVYIVADKTYWFDDLVAGTPQDLLPYGALPGSSGRSPRDDSVFWQSDRGLIVADKNQVVKNVQEDALAFGPARTGASLFRETDGMAHIVTSRAGTGPNTAAASSFMDAEIVRAGTQL